MLNQFPTIYQMGTDIPNNNPETRTANAPSAAQSPSVETTPQDQAAGLTQGGKPEKTASEALFDAIKEIPVAGPWIVWGIKQFGWKGLILFASGTLVGAAVFNGLLYTGKLPSALVADTYRQLTPVISPTPTPDPLKGELPIVEVEDLSALPLLADYYSYVLDSIAESLERGAVKAFTLKEAIQNETGESKWFIDLKSDANYEIKKGQAFRITSAGLDAKKEVSLIQSLAVDHSHTHFKLPPCRKGDTLVVIVVYQQREHPANDNPPDFHSYAP